MLSPRPLPLGPHQWWYLGSSSPHSSLWLAGSPWPPPSTALPLEKTLGWSPWFASLPNTAHVALCPATRWYKGHKHLQQKGTRKKQPGAAGTPAARPVGCWWQKGGLDGPRGLHSCSCSAGLGLRAWGSRATPGAKTWREARSAALGTTECPAPQGQITGWFPTFDTTLKTSFTEHSSDLIKTVTGSPGRTRQGGPWHLEHPLGAWH